MASLNQVNLIGYAGDDPKIIATQSQRKMAALTLATTEKGYKKQDGTEVPDKTEWHSVVIFGKLAEVVEKYVRKGALLYIQGKLSTRCYEKDGQKRYATEVVADNMQMLDRKPASSAEQQQQYMPPANPYEPPF